MYIADSSHNEIRKVTAPAPPAVAGIISVLAGTGDPAYTGDGGSAPLATLSNPPAWLWMGGQCVHCRHGQRCDPQDRGGHRHHHHRGRTGHTGNPGDGGPATAAYLNAPQASPSMARETCSSPIPITSSSAGWTPRPASSPPWPATAIRAEKGRQGDLLGRRKAGHRRRNQPPLLGCVRHGREYVHSRLGQPSHSQGHAVNGAITSASIISTIAGTGAPGFSGDGGRRQRRF